MSTTKKLTLRRMDSPIMVQRGNAPDVDTYAKFLRPGAAAIDPVEEQKISIADVSTGVKCSGKCRGQIHVVVFDERTRLLALHDAVCSAFFASDGVVFKHMQKDHPQELFGSGSVAISASGAKGEKSPPAVSRAPCVGRDIDNREFADECEKSTQPSQSSQFSQCWRE
jgi:hypothetical protein